MPSYEVYIPKFLTARQMVADGIFPVSQSTILKAAREHGIGKKMGRVVLFSPSDINALYEALPCPSNLSKGPKVQTGPCAGLSAAAASKKLQELLTKKPQKKSASKVKRNSSKKASTAKC